ncbi:MAG: hypothetical protein AAGK21_16340 [Bacteroidota bacterium]
MRVLALALLLAAPAFAQGRTAAPLPDTTAARYGTSGAVVLALTEYGLDAGGAFRARLTDDLSLTAEVSIGAGRDEREQSFSGLFGERITPFKRNYLLILPFRLGLERRLFRQQVEDNFRPFVQMSGGPTLGLLWPYFDDIDGNGQRSEGEERLGAFAGLGDADVRLGLGATVAVGAAFGRRSAQSLRFGLRGDYFPVEVELLETAPNVDDPSRQIFLTPVVSFHVGRLWE